MSSLQKYETANNTIYYKQGEINHFSGLIIVAALEIEEEYIRPAYENNE